MPYYELREGRIVSERGQANKQVETLAYRLSLLPPEVLNKLLPILQKYASDTSLGREERLEALRLEIEQLHEHALEGWLHSKKHLHAPEEGAPDWAVLRALAQDRKRSAVRDPPRGPKPPRPRTISPPRVPPATPSEPAVAAVSSAPARRAPRPARAILWLLALALGIGVLVLRSTSNRLANEVQAFAPQPAALYASSAITLERRQAREIQRALHLESLELAIFLLAASHAATAFFDGDEALNAYDATNDAYALARAARDADAVRAQLNDALRFAFVTDTDPVTKAVHACIDDIPGEFRAPWSDLPETAIPPTFFSDAADAEVDRRLVSELVHHYYNSRRPLFVAVAVCSNHVPNLSSVEELRPLVVYEDR